MDNQKIATELVDMAERIAQEGKSLSSDRSELVPGISKKWTDLQDTLRKAEEQIDTISVQIENSKEGKDLYQRRTIGVLSEMFDLVRKATVLASRIKTN